MIRRATIEIKIRVEYIYLFIRYADGQNPVWLWNKCIVTIIGIFLWVIIYGLHRNIQGSYRIRN